MSVTERSMLTTGRGSARQLCETYDSSIDSTHSRLAMLFTLVVRLLTLVIAAVRFVTPRCVRWCPTSEQQLAESERAMLAHLRIPFDLFDVVIENCTNGHKPHRIRTLIVHRQAAIGNNCEPLIEPPAQYSHPKRRQHEASSIKKAGNVAGNNVSDRYYAQSNSSSGAYDNGGYRSANFEIKAHDKAAKASEINAAASTSRNRESSFTGISPERSFHKHNNENSDNCKNNKSESVELYGKKTKHGNSHLIPNEAGSSNVKSAASDVGEKTPEVGDSQYQPCFDASAIDPSDIATNEAPNGSSSNMSSGCTNSKVVSSSHARPVRHRLKHDVRRRSLARRRSYNGSGTHVGVRKASGKRDGHRQRPHGKEKVTVSSSLTCGAGQCGDVLTPIILLHGFGGGLAMWSLNVEALSDNGRRRVYAIDLLGFGGSSRPTFRLDNMAVSDSVGSATVAASCVERQMTTAIERWRAAVGVRRAIFVGHALGGFLAASYALQWPDRVAHLVLVDPWGLADRQPSSAVATAAVSGQRHYIDVPSWARLIAVDLLQPFNPLSVLRAAGPLGPALVERFRPDLGVKFVGSVAGDARRVVPDYVYHVNAQRPSGEAGFRLMMNPLGWARRPMLHRLAAELAPAVGVTFVYGSRSWVDKGPGVRVKHMRARHVLASNDADAVAGVTDVEVVDGAGHHVYADRPQLFNRLVCAIARRVDSAVAAAEATAAIDSASEASGDNNDDDGVGNISDRKNVDDAVDVKNDRDGSVSDFMHR